MLRVGFLGLGKDFPYGLSGRTRSGHGISDPPWRVKAIGRGAEHADVIEVERQPERFLNTSTSILAPTYRRGPDASFYGPALREPVGRIHRAGTETAAVSLGCMQGALESGERVSGEVLARV